VLFASIQAMNLGVSIVSKEVRDKTADFLMTKPVSRKKILTAKLLAAFTTLAVTNIVYIVVVLISTLTVKSAYNLKIFLMITFTMFFVQLIFASIGVLISIVSGNIKSPISASLITVFGFFSVSMLGAIIGEDTIRYLSPFKYFMPEFILKNGAYETTFVFVSIFVVFVSIFVSYIIYLKKDIHTL
jgi:ABC-2 type transport system permease protein